MLLLVWGQVKYFILLLTKEDIYNAINITIIYNNMQKCIYWIQNTSIQEMGWPTYRIEGTSTLCWIILAHFKP